MKAHEIYQQLDPELVRQMLDWFRENDRNVYKSAIASVAANRKLRPVFVQKKTLPDQYAWMHKSLQLKPCDMIGEHLFQVWLMAGNQEILTEFCDGMGIEHDGKGSVEGELPASFDAAKLKETVDALLEKHDPRRVALYLHVFNLQRPDGWPEVGGLLEQDERLKLAA